MVDVLIVGGGASGLCTAIMLKKLNKSLSVLVLEKNERVAKKLSITGNGRCNITNADLSFSRFHSEDSQFFKYAVSDFIIDDTINFFRSIGVMINISEGTKAYPMSFQASSVTDALRFAADELGVGIECNNCVTEIKRHKDVFKVMAQSGSYDSKTVVVSTGGQAGGKLGDIWGYSLLKGLGHNILPLFPSIVQIKTENQIVRQLKGIKVNANAVAVIDDEVKREFGEVLFCEYGLSGPPILNLSRLAQNTKCLSIYLDLLPQLNSDEILKLCMERKSLYCRRPISEFLSGILHKRLGQVIVKSAGVGCNLVGEISDLEVAKIATTLKKFCFKVVGTMGLANAQVTAGGADTRQFCDRTLMSKKVAGLFATGEVLDVDGDCGGFNLAWAWASSNAASKGIIKYLNG